MRIQLSFLVRVAVLLAAVSVVGCRERGGITVIGGGEEEDLVSILDLKMRCEGDYYYISEGVTIRGVVIANDHFGEFPKTIVIQDSTAGLEILIEGEGLYRKYMLGWTVEIHCSGLALAYYGGKIQLGLPPTSPDYNLDRIPTGTFVRMVDDIEPYEFLARTITIDRIPAGIVSTYVRFEGVRFVDEEVGLPFFDRDPETGRSVATNRHLRDEAGNILILRTEATCVYGDNLIPSGNVRVWGVLDYFNNEYQLRLMGRGFQTERH